MRGRLARCGRGTDLTPVTSQTWRRACPLARQTGPGGRACRGFQRRSSPARRGAASEITAARHDHLAARLRAAGLGALADLGFTGLDPDPGDPVIITGWKSTATRKTTPAQRQANQALAAARAPVEHGFSDLKNWRILTRLSPANATTLLRALLVLTRQHTTR